MANGIVFRRIHGHVVPIKLSEEQKAGVGMIGTGLAGAAASGYLGARESHISKHYENLGHTFKKKMKMAEADAFHADLRGAGITATRMRQSAGKFKGLMNSNFVAAEKSHIRARRFQTGGQVVTASLVGAGIHKLLPEKVKHHQVADAVATVGSGLAAAMFVRSGYYKGISKLRPGAILGLAFNRVKARGFKV